ncbi:MAG: Mov34/MPN/PAD-1 family protein [Candidatus Hodarchaeota archaeon]
MTSLEKDFVFPVYIHEDILNQVKTLCRNIDREIFGYLIGLILKWENKKYIIIKDQIYVKNAVRSDKYITSQIEGTAGDFEKEFQKLKLRRKDKDLRVVGWWHSHIGLGSFLSATDIHTQESFFPESYQVALVVDPIREVHKFFTLNKDSIKKYKAVSSAIISSN